MEVPRVATKETGAIMSLDVLGNVTIKNTKILSQITLTFSPAVKFLFKTWK